MVARTNFRTIFNLAQRANTASGPAIVPSFFGDLAAAIPPARIASAAHITRCGPKLAQTMEPIIANALREASSITLAASARMTRLAAAPAIASASRSHQSGLLESWEIPAREYCYHEIMALSLHFSGRRYYRQPCWPSQALVQGLMVRLWPERPDWDRLFSNQFEQPGKPP
ncbi:MAG: hypothetical protein FJX29_13930 [Alphaproteobacteria bacterium]|nr:hypothetical protein [Alphaproteobacteria bacterium]